MYLLPGYGDFLRVFSLFCHLLPLVFKKKYLEKQLTIERLVLQLTDIELRAPTAEEGHRVHRLVAECAPLDPNSLYCNLLQSTHFAATSVAAVAGHQLVGFSSGYRIPARPDTLFVWQVAVGKPARGLGLATRMLRHLLASEGCRGVRFLETSITPDNRASWALFKGLATQLEAPLEESLLFDRERHFAGAHDSEMLARIGPFGDR